MAAPIVNEQPSAFAQVKRHLDGVSKSRVRQTRRYQEEQKGRKTVPEELANRLRGRRLLDIHTFRMVFAVDPCMNRHLIVAV